MVDIVEDTIKPPDERVPGVRTWQDQRMAAIGRLTSGSAHDFNNFLTVVIVMAGLLLDDLPSESPQHAIAREIRVATDWAAPLTDELLIFVRRPTTDLRTLFHDQRDGKGEPPCKARDLL